MKRYDLHLHSMYSLDSFSKPRDIIKQAVKLNLSGIAITDHNTIKGALQAKSYAKKAGIDLIMGEEISTSKGHVAGYFLNEEIKPGQFDQVLQAIKEQGGVAVLTHPFRRRTPSDKQLKEVHALETFNSKNSITQNRKAHDAAKRLQTPVTGGSDAHCLEDIGKGVTLVKNDLRKEILSGKTRSSGVNDRWLWRTELDAGRAVLKLLGIVRRY